MPEDTQQSRELSQTVRELKAHVQWKIDTLPEMAAHHNLSAQSITDLTKHLQDEIDYLDSLPPDTFYGDVMDNHFSHNALTEKVATGKVD